MDEEELSLEQLHERNVQSLERFAARGISINAEPLRVASMLEVLLGDRLDEAELLYEQRLSEHLEGIDRDVRRAAILQGPLNGA